jgi:hypothetical protein
MLLVIPLLLLLTTQQDKTFTWQVTEQFADAITVKADVRNPDPACTTSTDPLCVNWMLDIPVKYWPADQWGKRPHVGDKLPAKWKEAGKFEPVMADCALRREWAKRDYCGGDHYCRPPLQIAVEGCDKEP